MPGTCDKMTTTILSGGMSKLGPSILRLGLWVEALKTSSVQVPTSILYSSMPPWECTLG